MNNVSKAIFSLNGAALAIGTAGFLSAVVGMFVDTSTQMSIKWLLLSIWIFITIAIILLKIIHDFGEERRVPLPYETPIKHLPNDSILLIRRNEHFGNQIMVGCYSVVDDVEKLVSLGCVHHTQEKFIQIRLLPGRLRDEIGITQQTDIKTIVIRPVVPLSALIDHQI